MRLTPDPRPLAIVYPVAAPESLRMIAQMNTQASPLTRLTVETIKLATSSLASPVVATAKSVAGWSVVATEQSTNETGSSTNAVIKVSEVPLSQADKNLIPVGKMFSLNSGQSESKIIQKVSFEILDGFTTGQTSIELDRSTSIEATVDNENGTVSMSGDASVADYDKLLQSINLRLSGDASPNSIIRIRITLTDPSGQAESKVVTVRMNKPTGATLTLNN